MSLSGTSPGNTSNAFPHGETRLLLCLCALPQTVLQETKKENTSRTPRKTRRIEFDRGLVSETSSLARPLRRLCCLVSAAKHQLEPLAVKTRGKKKVSEQFDLVFHEAYCFITWMPENIPAFVKARVSTHQVRAIYSMFSVEAKVSCGDSRCRRHCGRFRCSFRCCCWCRGLYRCRCRCRCLRV